MRRFSEDHQMTDKEALEAAYLAGFNASGEGYNGEYPFGDRSERPEQDKDWSAERDEFIKQARALDKMAENARELGLDYEPHKGLSNHLAQATNGRVRIDPVTGNVGIGTPPAQPAPVPLTDEKIFAIGKELGLKCRLGGNPNIDIDYARAIEAAHGITGENT
jgi:hypothetical protein